MQDETVSTTGATHPTAANGERVAVGSGPGAPIFRGRHDVLKAPNKHTKTFTKRFYFKIYANDWVNQYDSTSKTTSVVHFGTVIPYQALCMYLSPAEYMEIVRGSHYCRIKETKLELKFKAIRTPFDANSTDLAEANGNLQFEIQRWDGLEHMLPFRVADLNKDNQEVVKTSYVELITRLYGGKALAEQVPEFKWPAVMRERGLTWRPVWEFNPNDANQTAPTAGMYRPINQYISSLPVGEFITDSMNTNYSKMTDGYCFNKVYRPDNGLLSMSSSAVRVDNTKQGTTRVNTKTRYKDTVMGIEAKPLVGGNQYASLFGGSKGDPVRVVSQTKPLFTHDNTAPTPAQAKMITTNTLNDGDPRPIESWRGKGEYELCVAYEQLVQTQDAYGFGYNNEMAYYTVANLENYVFFNPEHDPPVTHMPSMIIGIVPKVTRDNKVVQATAEFECTTSIEIECEDMHPTYVQCAYTFGDAETAPGYVDKYFNDARLFGGRWQHNEKDVALRDNKYWSGSYGLAGKPLFRAYDEKLPLY